MFSFHSARHLYLKRGATQSLKFHVSVIPRMKIIDLKYFAFQACSFAGNIVNNAITEVKPFRQRIEQRFAI